MSVPAAARWWALGALLLTTGALLVIIVWTTPWSPLPGPVPGGRVAVSAARDFTDSDIARENSYHRAVRPPAYLGLAAGLLVATVLGLTPLGARLVAAAARPFGGGWAWRAVVGGIAVALVARVAALPFDARIEVVLRRYGLSTQGWGGWLVDQARAAGVSAALLATVLLGFVALARASPQRWWLPAALAGAVLVLVLSFAYPVVVEPVFNRFHSLPAGELRTSLLALAAEDGVPVRDVLVADASRRTTALNAYVSGYGPTRRIVLYDTLIKTDPEEVRLVVAHELGHAKRNDVLHGTVEGALGLAAGMCLLFLLMTWAPLLRRAGVSSAGDPRSVALLLCLAALGAAAFGPAQALISRRIEARADVHALDLTRDPATFAASERRLGVRNLSDLDPSPLVYGLFADHPTPPERIALARDWARQHGVPPP